MPESGTAATVDFKNLTAGQYILVALKDINGNSKLDAGDYLGCYGASTTQCQFIEPGASGLEVQMEVLTALTSGDETLSLGTGNLPPLLGQTR